MHDILRDLAKVIRPAMLAIAPPTGSKRPSTVAVYRALKKARPVIEKRFRGPVYCRYSGCPEGPAKKYSDRGRVFKVLEYLWDFSFSRYAIPQAIEARKATRMRGGKFELLLVAESEMGTKDEICRDLLKLLEARTTIRCLVYRQPRRFGERHEFEARMIRVLHNHAHFQRSPGVWLFVALTWAHQKIECDLYTLDGDLNALTSVRTA
jgi:hypothetical protein